MSLFQYGSKLSFGPHFVSFECGKLLTFVPQKEHYSIERVIIEVGCSILISTNGENLHFIQIRIKFIYKMKNGNWVYVVGMQGHSKKASEGIQWSFCSGSQSLGENSLGFSFFASLTGPCGCSSDLVRTTLCVSSKMLYHMLMCMSHSSMP